MSDDLKKNAASTRAKITKCNIVKKFGVSPDESAVQKVGNSVAAVQQELS
jgi:hypothetical protein